METTLNWLKEYVKVDLSASEIDTLLTMSGSEIEERIPVRETGDTAFKVEITSNRPDCYGVLGLARELRALTGGAFTMPDASHDTAKPPAAELSSVEIECLDLCPYYSAQVITGVKVGPSPDWLLDRLETLAAVKSIRPVNNIVDITNFVMLETGQPLHAFDLAALDERRIVVRRAHKGETILAIDDNEYPLGENMCVIADANRAQCVGGVMGGKQSEISEKTVDVLLESAYFAPLSNRETVRTLGLHSDSSYRFSRGVDPGSVLLAQHRAARLIAEACGGIVHEGVLEAGALDVPEYKSRLRLDRIVRVLGIEIEPRRCIEILEGLGLKVKAKPNVLEVIAPSYRRDLTREIDLIEEIGRITGYEHVPEVTSLAVRAAPPTHRERVEATIRQELVAAGYCEAMSDTFVPETELYAHTPWVCKAQPAPGKYNKGAGSPAARRKGKARSKTKPHERKADVESAQTVAATAVADPPSPRADAPARYCAVNPVRKGQGQLRGSAMPSLLATRKSNQDHGELDVALFELTRVFLPPSADSVTAETRTEGAVMPDERRVLALTAADFATVKGTLERLFERLSVPVTLEPGRFGMFEAQNQARFLDGDGRQLAVCGVTAPALLAKHDLSVSCALGECDLSRLVELATFKRTFQELPRFPGMTREYALVLDLGVTWAAVADVVAKTTAAAENRVSGHDLLAGCRFLADYRGKPIPKGSKQYTFEARLQHPDRTLRAEEVNDLSDRIIQALKGELGAELRQ